MQRYYENNVDFFSLFEADTFDVEEQEGNTFMGYVIDEDTGERILAATFEYEDEDVVDGAGIGWWDTELI